VRILFLTNHPGWPHDSGIALRCGLHLEAMAGELDVDALFVLPEDRVPDPLVGPDVRARNVAVLTVPRLSGVGGTARWATSSMPWATVKVKWGQARDEVARRLAAERYDLVWLLDHSAWPAVPADVPAKMIVDLDDLEDEKIFHRMSNRAEHGVDGARERFFSVVDRVDLERWRRLQAEVASRADAIVLAGAADAAKVAHPIARMVPNGYRPVEGLEIAGGPIEGPPTLVYVGGLRYRPNVEAVTRLATGVLPVVRRRHPQARVRVVGDYGAEIAALASVPGIEIVGRVDHVRDELFGAHVTAVPMISGGGTRIKIIEAFAHGLPVVSSTIGAEGLEVEPGKHLVIEDDLERMGEAVADLLDDRAARVALAERAHDRFTERYTPAAVSSAIRAVIKEVFAT
jgi:glycosyltransferase involved in cell wall biosynthesis